MRALTASGKATDTLSLEKTLGKPACRIGFGDDQRIRYHQHGRATRHQDITANRGLRLDRQGAVLSLDYFLAQQNGGCRLAGRVKQLKTRTHGLGRLGILAIALARINQIEAR